MFERARQLLRPDIRTPLEHAFDDFTATVLEHKHLRPVLATDGSFVGEVKDSHVSVIAVGYDADRACHTLDVTYQTPQTIGTVDAIQSVEFSIFPKGIGRPNPDISAIYVRTDTNKEGLPPRDARIELVQCLLEIRKKSIKQIQVPKAVSVSREDMRVAIERAKKRKQEEAWEKRRNSPEYKKAQEILRIIEHIQEIGLLPIFEMLQQKEGELYIGIMPGVGEGAFSMQPMSEYFYVKDIKSSYTVLYDAANREESADKLVQAMRRRQGGAARDWFVLEYYNETYEMPLYILVNESGEVYVGDGIKGEPLHEVENYDDKPGHLYYNICSLFVAPCNPKTRQYVDEFWYIIGGIFDHNHVSFRKWMEGVFAGEE